jgi:hypothetical protein
VFKIFRRHKNECNRTCLKNRIYVWACGQLGFCGLQTAVLLSIPPTVFLQKTNAHWLAGYKTALWLFYSSGGVGGIDDVLAA